MLIRRDGTTYRAIVAFTSSYNPEGGWSLHIADQDGEMSDALVVWDPSPTFVSLLDRYDALASLGFAVVEGGGAAWEWKEHDDGQGGTHWAGTTGIRPLRADELPSTAPVPAGL